MSTSTTTDGSSSNNDTSRTSINESNSYTSNDFKVTRPTPYGPVTTHQEQPLFTERVVDYSSGTPAAMRERLWQEQKAQGENLSYTLNKYLGDFGAARWLRGEISGYVNLMMEQCVRPHQLRIEGDPQYRREFQRWAEEGQLDPLISEIDRLNNKMQELLQLAQSIETIKDYAAKQKRLGKIYQEIKDQVK
jgi:hypothetical protein